DRARPGPSGDRRLCPGRNRPSGGLPADRPRPPRVDRAISGGLAHRRGRSQEEAVSPRRVRDAGERPGSLGLNAGVGEGLDDAGLLPYVTSANVACGLHAGDPGTMEATVILALARGVRVGAHPGFPNRETFGRVRVEMSADAIESLVLYQISALDGFVRSRGATLTHVKPHGALYHSAAEFPDVARA